jgi:hypothetical protein
MCFSNWFYFYMFLFLEYPLCRRRRVGARLQIFVSQLQSSLVGFSVAWLYVDVLVHV